MYCRIAIVERTHYNYVVLLPDNFQHHEELKLWSQALTHDEVLYVSAVRLSLTIGDWLHRQLQVITARRSATIVQLQNKIQAMLADVGITTAMPWVKLEPQMVQHRISQARAMYMNSHLLRLLQGRKLLYEEWLGLVKDQLHVGISDHPHTIAAPNQHQSLSEAELLQAWRWLIVQAHVQLRGAVEWLDPRKGRAELRCLRCYESNLIHTGEDCQYCGKHCYYCSSCLQLGRSRTCTALLLGRYHSPVHKRTNSADLLPEEVIQLDRFSLSEAQRMATTHALSFVYKVLFQHNEQQHQRRVKLATTDPLSSQFLLWAVTGAGKTEMIFPLVAYMLALGGRVLLATPRRDVVLELSPRLQQAFPELSIVTLYGGSQQRWQYGQLVLATTHQLMRYQHAFDLVIIDELDAFPYHGDKRLYRVAAEARIPHGITILLSATPPDYVQKDIKRGKLAHIKLPVRYHRHPLPVPIRLKVPLVVEQLRSQVIPRPLLQAIQQSLAADAQIFIFLQRIVHTEAYAKLLRQHFPHIPIEATSSQDAKRGEKVMLFRQRQIRLLVTTTILERGVTVPRSHVYICDAEAELFDEASLVQMAGRAGRSSDAPDGAVYFLSQQWSAAQKQAIRQIKNMNKLARQQGYLLPQYKEERRGERHDG